MFQKIKDKPIIGLLGGLLLLSMIIGFELNSNTKSESEKTINEIQRSKDSSVRLLTDSLSFTISRYVQLQEQNRKFIADTIRLYKENKHLNKTITNYVQIKNDAEFTAIHKLSGAITVLEAKQRERESRQRQR